MTAALHLRKTSAGFDGFSLSPYGGFFIGPTQLQLFEQAALGKLVLENLQGLFHIIIKYLYFQGHPSFLVMVDSFLSPRIQLIRLRHT